MFVQTSLNLKAINNRGGFVGVVRQLGSTRWSTEQASAFLGHMCKMTKKKENSDTHLEYLKVFVLSLSLSCSVFYGHGDKKNKAD